MSGEGFLESTSDDIPETNCVVLTATCECQPIRTETYAFDTGGMSGESFPKFTGCDIPKANRPVCAPTGEHLPIRTETHAIDNIVVTEGLSVFAGGNIPEENPLV